MVASGKKVPRDRNRPRCERRRRLQIACVKLRAWRDGAAIASKKVVELNLKVLCGLDETKGKKV
jgi:hypothetical protein